MCESGSGLSETSSLSILSFHFFSASEHCTFLQSCSSLLTKHGRSIFYPSGSGAISSFCFNLFCFGSSICVTANMAKFFLSLWLIIAKGIKLFPTLSSANRLHVQHPYKQENSANYKIKKRFMVVNATRNSLNLSSNQVKHGQNSRLFFLTCTTAPSEFRFKCLSIQPPSSIVEQRSSEHRRASSGSWIPERRTSD